MNEMHGVTMLFVEDDADTREIVGGTVLRRYPGLVLRTAANGREGLESFRAHAVDIILTDISMPVMDGLEMATAVRTLDTAVPIVFLTAYNDTQYLLDAIRIGASRYVLKPVEYPMLFEAIDGSLAKVILERRLRGQNEALRRAKEELEQMVAERTRELAATVATLQEEIAERIGAGEALRESERKYRTLFEESKDVIFMMGTDGGLLDINPAGSELFGYAKDELLGLTIIDLHRDAADGAHLLRMLRDQGEIRDCDLKMRTKNGKSLHMLMTASLVRGERGDITGARGILHDVTERRSLEQQLLQAQKMESIGLLAGGVAHDFNNLMTAVLGYGQLIQDNPACKADETLQMCATQVVDAAGRATELTRNLLAFSRKQIINPKPVSMNDLIVNLTKLLRRIIGEDIELTTSLVSRHLIVMADGGQIDQVLVNLAANARDAMPDGGRLHIRTKQAVLDNSEARLVGLDTGGGYALLEVSDTGIGMDARTRERIFEPFFTTKETGKGTGLGLAIIYGIVKQHGGTIAVESEPGAGSTFRIYFPLTRAEVAEETVPEAPPLPCGTETLLLAEDDAGVRTYSKRILEMAGYTVLTAQNGDDAVEQFLEHRYSIALVVCDVIMPKKNGREVYEEVRRLHPQVRFIFTSGYNDEIIHKKGVLEGDFDFLMKPVARRDLLEKVREVIDRG
jgi:PAS domain S-box-containing protein